MRRTKWLVDSSILIGLLVMACGAAPEPQIQATEEIPAVVLPLAQKSGSEGEMTCEPTAPDMLGPFYKPGAPLRNQVGQGYVLRGVVRSAVDCSPLPGAQVEFWLAGPDGQYGDDYRGTIIAGEDGTYQLATHFPPPYSGRPSHIHLRASGAGYQVLVTQHYPEEGATQATFDLVLSPDS